VDLGLAGRIAWVTGASRGIGFAIAQALAAEGARLALGARGAAGLAEAADRLVAAGHARPTTQPLDLTDPAAVAAWAADCRAQLGPAGVLVVCSGGPPAGRHDELSPALWRQAADLLLHGTVALVEAALPAMAAAGWGRVLIVSSLAVRQPVEGLMLSNSLRAAVQGYIRTLATEVAPAGITVNGVAPGYTRTERLRELSTRQAAMRGVSEAEVEAGWLASIPAGRLAEPREIAAAAAFLAGEPAGYITGQLVTVDGGCVRSLL
jgi:3-oxoacyl-[acyl-carrier protein] reductase